MGLAPALAPGVACWSEVLEKWEVHRYFGYRFLFNDSGAESLITSA
jgi:hypothetical protein